MLLVCLWCVPVSGLVASVGPDGSNARALHEEGLTGNDVGIVLISIANARATHEAFARNGSERAVIAHAFPDTQTTWASHDTQMAGILVSQGGAEHPDCRGIAPGAVVHSARITDRNLSPFVLDRALNELIVNQGCRIVVTGVQIPTAAVTPDGTSVWSRIYDYYAQRYDVFFANAAGNSDSTVTVFGDGANGITTGGLALDADGRYRVVGSISNPGPTPDNRRKPELMAPAQRQRMPNASGDTGWSVSGSARGETSFAAPHTAGAAALLMELAAQTETPDADRSLTIKAVLVNAADPNVLDKDKQTTDPQQTGWHRQRGYGRLDVARAAAQLRAGRVEPETTIQTAAGWAYESLDVYQRHRYRLQAQQHQQLTLTVTWHRKLIRNSAVSYLEEAPRFNLLVEVKSPSGRTLFSEYDPHNNLRKADLTLPEEGLYEIIIHNQVYQSDRHYAMAFELRDANPE